MRLPNHRVAISQGRAISHSRPALGKFPKAYSQPPPHRLAPHRSLRLATLGRVPNLAQLAAYR